LGDGVMAAERSMQQCSEKEKSTTTSKHFLQKNNERSNKFSVDDQFLA
jgi:hypothetical protein